MSIIYYQDTPLKIGSSQIPLSFDSATLQSDIKKYLSVLNVNSIAVISQVHGSEILEVSLEQLIENSKQAFVNLGQADAIIISAIESELKPDKAIAVGIRSADCLALVIEGNRNIALIHAGWRSLAAGIIEKTLLMLSSDKYKETDFKIWIGPAAKKCCYEVGDEVLAALNQAQATKCKIDLQHLAHDRIKVLKLNCSLQIDERCTICTEILHSYRREQGNLRNFTFAKI